AISLVVVPRKPCCEKRRTATRRICRRRSSPAIRPLASGSASVLSLLTCLLKNFSPFLFVAGKVSTYLPSFHKRSQGGFSSPEMRKIDQASGAECWILAVGNNGLVLRGSIKSGVVESAVSPVRTLPRRAEG